MTTLNITEEEIKAVNKSLQPTKTWVDYVGILAEFIVDKLGAYTSDSAVFSTEVYRHYESLRGRYPSLQKIKKGTFTGSMSLTAKKEDSRLQCDGVRQGYYLNEPKRKKSPKNENVQTVEYDYFADPDNPLTLDSITLKNYRNLKGNNLNNAFTIDLSRESDLTIFIGPNGAGKSNVISVLELLKNSLIPIDDPTRGVTSFEDAVTKLGTGGIVDKSLNKPATTELTYQFSDGPYAYTLDVGLLVSNVSNSSTVNISSERLVREKPDKPDNPFIYYTRHTDRMGTGIYSAFNELNNLKELHFEQLENVPTNELMLSSIIELLEESQFAPEHTPLYSSRRQISTLVSQWQFYNANHMNLDEVRKSEPRIGPRDHFVSGDGINLARVFDNLVQTDYEFEEKIQHEMKQLFPSLRRIRPTRSGRLSLTIETYFEGIREPFYLDELSDGTVRMLCWAIILLSNQLPTLIVIDEPEIGLHPSWIGTLATWIKRASKKTQIIISTHSPDLLDKFTDVPESVHVFHPHVDNPMYYSVRQLSSERLRSWFDDGWELGDLYRIGAPEVGGWPA